MWKILLLCVCVCSSHFDDLIETLCDLNAKRCHGVVVTTTCFVQTIEQTTKSKCCQYGQRHIRIIPLNWGNYKIVNDVENHCYIFFMLPRNNNGCSINITISMIITKKKKMKRMNNVFILKKKKHNKETNLSSIP